MKIDNKSFCDLKRRAFDRYFARLNDRQREAVYKINGPLLVLAGAGSGKTTVLVNRIANIIMFGDAYNSISLPADDGVADALQKALNDNDTDALKQALVCCADGNVPAYKVLCLTFTNKAAGEFKDRLRVLLGDAAGDIWAGTFHSICVRILRRYIGRLGYNNDFTIYDTDDTKKLLTDVMKRLNINTDLLPLKAVVAGISRAKNAGVTPDEYQKEMCDDVRARKIAAIYAEYQASLKKNDALDFDDIIMLTNTLFETDSEVLEHYRDQFEYILCDEYQDTNPAQSKLVYLLAGKKHNICVVGDDDQSIYRFRGATVENILKFGTVFPEAVTIRLEQNYRSTGNILGAANSIIANNGERLGKDLWTDAGDGEPVVIKSQYTQSEEATYIINCIRAKVASGEYKYRDFAVLFRMNAQSNALEIILSKSRIPYRIYGGLRFYERREIKDIVAYLSVILRHNDDVRLMRIINLPKRGIGAATISDIQSIALRDGLSMFDVIERADGYPELHKSSGKLAGFANLIKELTLDSTTMPLDELVKAVIDKTGYVQMLNEEEDDETREDNLREFVSSAVSYIETTREPTLAGFLEDIALVSDTDNYDTDIDAVTLMTVHSAKGLEFPVVFIPGFEEGIFPSAQSIGEPGGIEEERRLAYVAITRAKKQVMILHTGTRLMYGKTSSNPISRFAQEIDDRYVGETTSLHPAHASESKRRYAASQESFRQKTTVVKYQEPTLQETVFAPGDRVKHATFGGGTIVKSEILGGDVLYEISFDTVGTKRLMGNYAKLNKE